MATSFEIAYKRLLDLEGITVVNEVTDPGGLSKYGISKAAYPEEDIAHLTPERASFLTKRDYWDPLLLDTVINSKIQFQLLESAFHFDARLHPKRATLCAQVALEVLGVSVTVDMVIGPITIAAINGYSNQLTLYKMMNGVQLALLLVGASGTDELLELITARLPQLKVYMAGWLRRIEI